MTMSEQMPYGKCEKIIGFCLSGDVALINFTVYMTHGLFSDRFIKKLRKGQLFSLPLSLLFLEQTQKQHPALYIIVGEPKANETTVMWMSASSYQPLLKKIVCKTQQYKSIYTHFLWEKILIKVQKIVTEAPVICIFQFFSFNFLSYTTPSVHITYSKQETELSTVLGSGVLKSTFTILSVLGERINASEPLRSPWSWKETRHITAVNTQGKMCIRIQVICETVFMQMAQEALEEL